MSADNQNITRGDKSKVLILCNVAYWILGSMSKEIFNLFSSDYDIYILTDATAYKRPDILDRLMNNVDFVHAMDEHAFYVLKPYLSDLQPPILTWIHHFTSWSDLHALAVAHSEVIIACTDGWAERIGQQIANPHPPIFTVRHGVDHDRFKPSQPMRSHFGIPEDGFAVGFVASKGSDKDANRKGIDTLFKTIDALAGKLGNLHVCFTSGGWQDEVSALRKKGISANDAGYIPLDMLPNFYCSLDVYLMTSRVEGGPCTVLESMACGTPVVATAVGLVPEVINDAENGFMAAIDDHQALADKTLSLAASPAKAQAIADAARKTVANMSWSDTMRALAVPYGIMTQKAREKGFPQSRANLPEPGAFLKTVCVADAILLAWRAYRKGGSLLGGLKRELNMTKGAALPDLLNGLLFALKLKWK